MFNSRKIYLTDKEQALIMEALNTLSIDYHGEHKEQEAIENLECKLLKVGKYNPDKLNESFYEK